VNYSAAGTKKGADPHYDVMGLADIKALPVGHLARQDAILLLWSTGAMLRPAENHGPVTVVHDQRSIDRHTRTDFRLLARALDGDCYLTLEEWRTTWPSK
jgi:hypothetical protein